MSEESEIKSRIDTSGDDPAVRAALSPELPRATHAQILEISLAVEKILKGQNSILERINQNDQKASEQLAKLRERMDKLDEAERRWEEDREKFIQNAYNNAEKLKVTGDAKEKMDAQFASIFQREVVNARAEIAVSKANFEDELRRMPTEVIISRGILETVIEGGIQTQKITPEIIRIKHKTWVLPPGKAVEVPKIVADRLREKLASEMETAERKEALQKEGDSSTLIQKWNQINRKFGSPTELMRT